MPGTMLKCPLMLFPFPRPLFLSSLTVTIRHWVFHAGISIPAKQQQLLMS